jgi:hypothetical protein
MPISHLRRVGCACFVNCFEDFALEKSGSGSRADTIEAMFARGGARTANVAQGKACGGNKIFEEDLVEEALRYITGARVPSSIRERAAELLRSRQAGRSRGRRGR